MNIHDVKVMMPQMPLWIVGTNDVAEPICSCRSVIHQAKATGVPLIAMHIISGQLLWNTFFSFPQAFTSSNKTHHRIMTNFI